MKLITLIMVKTRLTWPNHVESKNPTAANVATADPTHRKPNTSLLFTSIEPFLLALTSRHLRPTSFRNSKNPRKDPDVVCDPHRP